MVDKRDPISYTKYVRNLPSTERLLRQFLKTETGLGASPAYKRGWTFNFEFSDEQRAHVNELMNLGMSFDEAFDFYVLSRSKRDGDVEREGAAEASENFRGAEASPGQSPEAGGAEGDASNS